MGSFLSESGQPGFHHPGTWFSDPQLQQQHQLPQCPYGGNKHWDNSGRTTPGSSGRQRFRSLSNGGTDSDQTGQTPGIGSRLGCGPSSAADAADPETLGDPYLIGGSLDLEIFSLNTDLLKLKTYVDASSVLPFTGISRRKQLLTPPIPFS